MSHEAITNIIGLATDRDLVFAFFAAYSRFEYALKRAGFLKSQDKAQPDWDKFANSLRGRLLVDAVPAFQAARDYLVGEPPQTQVVEDGGLGWEPTARGDGESAERYLLRLVSTVRNNLFHGGKYPYPFGPVPEAARNRQLLESAVTVLERCLEVSPQVRQALAEVA